MVYDNPYQKRVKGSHLILISCGYCKAEIALYQKAGKGSLLRMYIDRIVKSSIDLSEKPAILVCPECKGRLATKVTTRKKNSEAYSMIRGVFNVARRVKG